MAKKILASVGTRVDPIVTPSTCWYNSSSKTKQDSLVANVNKQLNWSLLRF